MLEKFDIDLIKENIEKGCPLTLGVLHTLLGAIKLAKFKDNYDHLVELSQICYNFSSEKIAQHHSRSNDIIN